MIYIITSQANIDVNHRKGYKKYPPGEAGTPKRNKKSPAGPGGEEYVMDMLFKKLEEAVEKAKEYPLSCVEVIEMVAEYDAQGNTTVESQSSIHLRLVAYPRHRKKDISLS